MTGTTDSEPTSDADPVVSLRDERTDAETSQRVVTAVAAATEKGVEELEPLYYSVDPDALNDLFAASRGDLEVEFTYEGVDVTVEPDGSVTVTDRDDRR